MEMVVLCLTVCVVKTLLLLCLVVLRGRASETSKAGAGCWGKGPAPLASPCVRMVLSGTLKRIISSGGPADPDVTRWGWGRSPATGLAASDKNPREEFAAPFNTVIIFSAFYGWGRLLQECLYPSLQKDAQGWQVCRITS